MAVSIKLPHQGSGSALAMMYIACPPSELLKPRRWLFHSRLEREDIEQRWHPEKKHWTVPSAAGMVEQLVSWFEGECIEVDPTLRQDWETIRRILGAVENELTLRCYSPRTHKAYLGHLKRFLNHLGQDVETLDGAELRDYFLDLVESGISWSYQNQAISAVKFLYRHVLRQPEVLEYLPRPVRRKKQLPAVLSQGEVCRLFKSVENLIQAVFQRARDKAGIRKDATVHTLRHSFTTHLHFRYLRVGLPASRLSRCCGIYRFDIRLRDA